MKEIQHEVQIVLRSTVISRDVLATLAWQAMERLEDTGIVQVLVIDDIEDEVVES